MIFIKTYERFNENITKRFSINDIEDLCLELKDLDLDFNVRPARHIDNKVTQNSGTVDKFGNKILIQQGCSLDIADCYFLILKDSDFLYKHIDKNELINNFLEEKSETFKSLNIKFKAIYNEVFKGEYVQRQAFMLY